MRSLPVGDDLCSASGGDRGFAGGGFLGPGAVADAVLGLHLPHAVQDHLQPLSPAAILASPAGVSWVQAPLPMLFLAHTCPTLSKIICEVAAPGGMRDTNDAVGPDARTGYGERSWSLRLHQELHYRFEMTVVPVPLVRKGDEA